MSGSAQRSTTALMENLRMIFYREARDFCKGFYAKPRWFLMRKMGRFESVKAVVNGLADGAAEIAFRSKVVSLHVGTKNTDGITFKQIRALDGIKNWVPTVRPGKKSNVEKVADNMKGMDKNDLVALKARLEAMLGKENKS